MIYEGGRSLNMYRDLNSIPVLAKAGGKGFYTIAGFIGNAFIIILIKGKLSVRPGIYVYFW